MGILAPVRVVYAGSGWKPCFFDSFIKPRCAVQALGPLSQLKDGEKRRRDVYPIRSDCRALVIQRVVVRKTECRHLELQFLGI